MSIVAGTLIGPFTIEKSLASSGMATIFVAHETERPDCRVALKVARTDTEHHHTFKDLIQHETAVLNQLRHPGVVRIYPLVIHGKTLYSARAASQKDQPFYFAMELLEGEPLSNQMKLITERYPFEWRIELFYQLLVIVAYMHAHDIAHCDLKPDNILFRNRLQIDEIPSPVLIDFGTSSEIDRLTSEPAGTIAYAAPELLLALHAHIDRSQLPPLLPDKFDIWALGAIFFELMTGRQLVRARNKEQAFTSIVKGELPTIASIRPDLPESLDVLLKVMLRRTPEERPPVEQLVRALEEKVSRPPRITHLRRKRQSAPRARY